MSDYDYDYWRVRVVIHHHDYERIVERLRAAQKERATLGKIEKRHWRVVIIRTVPRSNCADALSASLFVGDLIYRSWPEGEKLPYNLRTTVEFKAGATDGD